MALPNSTAAANKIALKEFIKAKAAYQAGFISLVAGCNRIDHCNNTLPDRQCTIIQ